MSMPNKGSNQDTFNGAGLVGAGEDPAAGEQRRYARHRRQHDRVQTDFQRAAPYALLKVSWFNEWDMFPSSPYPVDGYLAGRQPVPDELPNYWLEGPDVDVRPFDSERDARMAATILDGPDHCMNTRCFVYPVDSEEIRNLMFCPRETINKAIGFAEAIVAPWTSEHHGFVYEASSYESRCMAAIGKLWHEFPPDSHGRWMCGALFLSNFTGESAISWVGESFHNETPESIADNRRIVDAVRSVTA